MTELTVEILDQKLSAMEQRFDQKLNAQSEMQSEDLRDRSEDLRDRMDSLKTWVIGIFIAGVIITGAIVGAFSSAVLIAMAQ